MSPYKKKESSVSLMSERFKTSERGQTAEYMVRADKSDIMPQKLNSKTSKSISKIDPSIEEYDLMKTSFEEKDIKQQSLIQKLRRKIDALTGCK